MSLRAKWALAVWIARLCGLALYCFLAMLVAAAFIEILQWPRWLAVPIGAGTAGWIMLGDHQVRAMLRVPSLPPQSPPQSQARPESPALRQPRSRP